MTKNVALSNSMVARLDAVRKRFDVSYTDAIELIAVQPDMDLAIVAINKRFAELETLLPGMREVWQSLNLVAVHMHRLSPQQQIDQTAIVVDSLTKVVDHIVTVKLEESSNDTN